MRGKADTADTGFLYWFLAQNQVVDYLHSIAENSTSTYPSIRQSDLEQLTLFLPPLPEQRAIAHILGTLDDKIELNRCMNETLEAMARAIFKDWFVDFGPTRAKAQGRAPYLPQDLWSLFPDSLSSDGNPAEWGQGTLADLANSPKRSIRPADVSNDTPYIGLEHMPRRSIALSEWEGASKISSNKSQFNKGEILFGKLRPYFHKVGAAPLDGICSTDILVIVPRAQNWGCLCSSVYPRMTS